MKNLERWLIKERFMGDYKVPTAITKRSREKDELVIKHVFGIMRKQMAKIEEEVEAQVDKLDDLFERLGRINRPLRKGLDDTIRAVREKRMAITSEVNAILVSLTDLRKFFLSDDHEKEVKRLEEFATLCERLLALKRSGFLDSVTDTILRLEEGMRDGIE